MRFHAPEAVELFRLAGARVSDGNRVRIPPHLVERALTRASNLLLVYPDGSAGAGGRPDDARHDRNDRPDRGAFGV
jgi:hypothetical protein